MPNFKSLLASFSLLQKFAFRTIVLESLTISAIYLSQNWEQADEDVGADEENNAVADFKVILNANHLQADDLLDCHKHGHLVKIHTHVWAATSNRVDQVW